MEETILTREQLYELVWITPMIQLAKKYDISDNGLRKICKGMDIPLPEQGHWQKVQYGKSVRIKKLSKDYSGKNEINLSERDNENQPIDSAIYRKRALIKSYENLDQSFFKVSKRLISPSKYIVAVQKTLVSEKGLRFSDDPHVSNNRDELKIKVSPANIGRALRFFDTLIKLLRYRGHDVIIDGITTCAVIKDVKIEIALREKMRIERVMGKYWPNNKYHPTDVLILKIDRWSRIKDFSDGKIKLEDKLPMILADLEYRAQKEIEWRIESEKQRIIEEERKRIERELKERKEKEMQKFKNLFNQFDRWQQSRNLREYISAIEEKSSREEAHSEELTSWANWANQKADWYDPTIRKRDEITGFYEDFN